MKASLRCWFRDVTALARSWTSLVGFQGERPADRLPGQPCARWRAQLREQGESFKRVNCMLARCFKQSDLALPTGG